MTQKACIGVGYKKELQEVIVPGKHTDSSCGNITTGDRAPAARDIAAKKVGVSGKVVDMAERMMALAPAKAERMMAGELSVWDAKREIEHEAKEALAEHLNAQPVPLPGGRFNVINGHPVPSRTPHANSGDNALRGDQPAPEQAGLGYNEGMGMSVGSPQNCEHPAVSLHPASGEVRCGVCGYVWVSRAAVQERNRKVTRLIAQHLGTLIGGCKPTAQSQRPPR